MPQGYKNRSLVFKVRLRVKTSELKGNVPTCPNRYPLFSSVSCYNEQGLFSQRAFEVVQQNAQHQVGFNTISKYFTNCFINRPVSSVAKRTLSVREVWGSIPGPVKSAQCRQRLATVATFLRSCVAQALSRGDGPHHSLRASA